MKKNKIIIALSLCSFSVLVSANSLPLKNNYVGAVTENTDPFYFYKLKDKKPKTPAPAPTLAQADVISMFSEVYTSVPVATWSANWDKADVEEITIDGNKNMKYTNMGYAGIDLGGAQIDASKMNYIHLDVWTNNAATFNVKLVDFGAVGANSKTESELYFTPKMSSWVSLDIPLSDFKELATTTKIGMLVLSGSDGTVYLDNLYFYSKK